MDRIKTVNHTFLMKKLIISAAVVSIFVVMLHSTPTSWFLINKKMSRTAVYELCGLPDSTTLWDIKGELWKMDTPLGDWTMFVSFRDDHTRHQNIWVDLKPKSIGIRLYIVDNGEFDISI